jgi:hypothetical protein
MPGPAHASPSPGLALTRGRCSKTSARHAASAAALTACAEVRPNIGFVKSMNHPLSAALTFDLDRVCFFHHLRSVRGAKTNTRPPQNPQTFATASYVGRATARPTPAPATPPRETAARARPRMTARSATSETLPPSARPGCALVRGRWRPRRASPHGSTVRTAVTKACQAAAQKARPTHAPSNPQTCASASPALAGSARLLARATPPQGCAPRRLPCRTRRHAASASAYLASAEVGFSPRQWRCAVARASRDSGLSAAPPRVATASPRTAAAAGRVAGKKLLIAYSRKFSNQTRLDTRTTFVDVNETVGYMCGDNGDYVTFVSGGQKGGERPGGDGPGRGVGAEQNSYIMP